MKRITITATVWKALGLLVFSALLFSFAPRPGGEGYEIFLDNKLVVQRFGNQLNNIKSLALDQRSATSQLSVKYHHCGKAGKNRQISIRDAKNNLLKEWRFPDIKDPYASMDCQVKDILGFQKGAKTQTVNLYYSSSELPKGRMLASIVLQAKNFTTP